MLATHPLPLGAKALGAIKEEPMSKLIMQMEVIEQLARLITRSEDPKARSRAGHIIRISREAKDKLERSFWTAGRPLSDPPVLHKPLNKGTSARVAPDLLARYK